MSEEERIEKRVTSLLKTFDRKGIVRRAKSIWVPHPLMKNAPNSITQISVAVRNIVGREYFQRLQHISQLGYPLNLLFLGKLRTFTVFDHTWAVYELVNHFARKERFEPVDLETVRVAAVIHDLFKPPWTPISEIFMLKTHEELLTELTELKKEKDVAWCETLDAVQGKGKFGCLFESEGDFDKLGYVAPLSDSLNITNYEQETKPETHFGMKEALKLISWYKIVPDGEKSHLAIEPDPNAITLFSSFLTNIVEQYKLFLNRYIAICEGLAFRILEDLIEGHVITENWFNDINMILKLTDYDLNSVLNNLKGENETVRHAKSLWLCLTQRSIDDYECAEIPYSDVLGDFINKVRQYRILRKGESYMTSKYRSLFKNTEGWVAREVGAKREEVRDFILMTIERIKPDFATTYNIDDWSWAMKVKYDGLDALGTHERIKNIKEEERQQLNRIVCIFPSKEKYRKRLNQISWKELPVSPS